VLVASDRIIGAPVVFHPSGDAGPATRARWAPILDRDAGDAPILLLGCGKAMLDHPAPAGELYIGPVFRARRAFAESSGLRWYILTAKHGLLDPEEMIGPYDLPLARQPVSYRRAWGEQVAEQLTVELGHLTGRRFELHAGAAFTEPLCDSLPARGAVVTTPLAGHNQGQTMQWYAAEAMASHEFAAGLPMCHDDDRHHHPPGCSLSPERGG